MLASRRRATQCCRWPQLILITVGLLCFLGSLRLSLLALAELRSAKEQHETSTINEDGKSSNVPFGQPPQEIDHQASVLTDAKVFPPAARDAHVFYYMWYGTPAKDGKWLHWDHPFMIHRNREVAERYPAGRHHPDQGDIGSAYWPKLGLYSSKDRDIIRAHLHMMRDASVGVAILSWYPPGRSDVNGASDSESRREQLGLLLDEALKVGVEVAIHVEAYAGRNSTTLRRDLTWLLEHYGAHKAIHRRKPAGKHRDWLDGKPSLQDKALPLIYVYDSYLTSPTEWASLLTPDGNISIRGTELDAIVLCLWVEREHDFHLATWGFDGAYSYFAAEGFTWGSTVANWPVMMFAATRHGTFFSPTVGPGYNDVRIRPWNQRNVRDREDGQYFQRMFDAAISIAPPFLSISSWNEWHEGTNIEPAISMSSSAGQMYDDYGQKGSSAYLDKIATLISSWARDGNTARI
eukprot:TRINITY_DN35871_c0_g1_i1.p1 TRINITY_DN35871_c0_g1~~TRINITY_DN35871_c0_g1_i1.p1  ORF type:complete len:463 (+),score=46.27 TRINITY_DN35871_c0_g1_i1:100-1488(+)